MPIGPVASDQRARYRKLVAKRGYRYARMALMGVGTWPWWLPLARAYLPLGPLGQVLDQLFVVVCHRLPARTLTLAGEAMPVCSRCGGIFAGLALAGMLAYPRISLRGSRGLLLLAGALMLADVLRQDVYGGGVVHPLRILSGIAVGYTTALGALAALRGPAASAPNAHAIGRRPP